MTAGTSPDRYALNWNTGWAKAPNPLSLVRRRRWVRPVELEIAVDL